MSVNQGPSPHLGQHWLRSGWHHVWRFFAKSFSIADLPKVLLIAPRLMFISQGSTVWIFCTNHGVRSQSRMRRNIGEFTCNFCTTCNNMVSWRYVTKIEIKEGIFDLAHGWVSRLLSSLRCLLLTTPAKLDTWWQWSVKKTHTALQIAGG